MFERVGTRFRTGYSPYGPPPVAVIELRAGQAATKETVFQRIRWLEQQGLLPTDPASGEARTGRELARTFGKLVARLLSSSGHHVGHPQVECCAGSEGHFRINLACEEPRTTTRATELAGRLLFGTAPASSAETRAVEAFLDWASSRMPHPDTRRIIQAARQRGLPVIRLDQDPFESLDEDRPFLAGLIQVGQGVRRRVLAGAVPALERSRLIRVVSRDLLVEHLLRHDMPLPPQDLDFPNKNRASRALRAAERLSSPVCLRAIHRQPFAYARQYVSVFEPLCREREIVHAYQAASADNRRVWVEASVEGGRVRCLIVGGELVAATLCRPPTITGDGRHSVGQLITQARQNAGNPRRRQAWQTLETGDGDLAARLTIAGLQPQSILEPGRTITLRGEGTAFNGGSLENVLGRLSGPIRDLAERAASVFELDEIAAVDLAVVDPGGEASVPNCHVLDVVPDPDLLSHIERTQQTETRIPERLVETLFPPGKAARIPTVSITGTNGKTTTSRMTAAILRGVYGNVGLATTEGAFLNDQRIVCGDVAGGTGAAQVLADDRTQAAVLETARGGLHKEGTALEVVDAAACLNIASDHLGVDGIGSLDELASVKARVLELADGHAVVNADDPRCLAMIGKSGHAQPILISRHADSSVVGEHLAAGHKAVLITGSGSEEESLVFARGRQSERLMRTHEIPAVMDGLLPFNALNAAFAAALCWSLGVDAQAVREGLSRFTNSVHDNPGRYNFIEGHSFTLLTDFAQNAHGLAELYSVVEKLSVTGKRRLVCLTIGSRHREHIEENARDLADRFDSLIIGCSDYADENPQYAGSNPRETMLAHFRHQLLEAGTSPERFETHVMPETAIRRGLEIAQPGDLLVVLGSPKVVLPTLEETAEP